MLKNNVKVKTKLCWVAVMRIEKVDYLITVMNQFKSMVPDRLMKNLRNMMLGVVIKILKPIPVMKNKVNRKIIQN